MMSGIAPVSSLWEITCAKVGGWWLWAALIFFLVGRSYAEPFDQITDLNPPRKALAVLALLDSRMSRGIPREDMLQW